MADELRAGIELNKIKKVYFLGIGGIGMSALARFFRDNKINVEGYDKTPSSLTQQLELEGMKIHFEEDISAIPKDADLVVYTPAVPSVHKELDWYRHNGYRVVKRSDVLQAISATGFNICIAGTHGKTTISTMTAHLLRESGYGCQAFLGGIAVNYDTNYWNTNAEVNVIEADEYDRSFLKLDPDVAVITAMDADHLDIYGDEQTMQNAFIEFGGKIKPEGLLISKFGLQRVNEISLKKKLTYSAANDAADVHAVDLEMKEGGYRFNISWRDEVLTGFQLLIGGMHNVENALAAVAIGLELQIDAEKLKAALASFKGVKRRFEYVLPPRPKKTGEYVQPVLIDDYAHHPEELNALLKSVRSLFPQRRVTVVFQPHLFSRTRDLAEGFAEALSIADRIQLLPIYPAREQPIEGVTSAMIAEKISKEDKAVVSKEELMTKIKGYAMDLNKEFGEVFVMAGAGDIDTLVQSVANIVSKRN